MTASPAPRVCAVIVTHNRLTLLRAALDALLAQERSPDAVLVVDNASEDDTAAWLRDRRPEVAVLRLPVNRGAASGFAAGLAWAVGRQFDWIWLMDDDVAPDRGCLRELLDVAADASKKVVVPRRVDPGGEDCGREAILDEAAQRIECVRVDPALERYRSIDVFTFEGPLIHRSVVAAAGLPDAEMFIRGDDVAYSVAINRRCGALSCALAARAWVQRQRPSRDGIVGRSSLKARLTGDPHYTLLPDADHWKMVYGLRNLHIISRRLGWRRMAARVAVAHLGYAGVDLLFSLRHGWAWGQRLRWTLRAWRLGVTGSAHRFLEPAAYRAELEAQRGRHQEHR